MKLKITLFIVLALLVSAVVHAQLSAVLALPRIIWSSKAVVNGLTTLSAVLKQGSYAATYSLAGPALAALVANLGMATAIDDANIENKVKAAAGISTTWYKDSQNRVFTTSQAATGAYTAVSGALQMAYYNDVLVPYQQQYPYITSISSYYNDFNWLRSDAKDDLEYYQDNMEQICSEFGLCTAEGWYLDDTVYSNQPSDGFFTRTDFRATLGDGITALSPYRTIDNNLGFDIFWGAIQVVKDNGDNTMSVVRIVGMWALNNVGSAVTNLVTVGSVANAINSRQTSNEFDLLLAALAAKYPGWETVDNDVGDTTLGYDTSTVRAVDQATAGVVGALPAAVTSGMAAAAGANTGVQTGTAAGSISNTGTTTVPQPVTVTTGAYTGQRAGTAYVPEFNNFSLLISTFMANMKLTGIFSLPGQLTSNIPSSDVCTIAVDCGRFGEHTVSFCNWTSIFNVLKGLFLLCCSVVAVRVIVLKG